MEEENIVVSNENNVYETIDITETDNNISPDETIQVIEIEEPETYNIESDSAFPALGEQNEQLNHALMTNRDLPDQHPISAITGLRQELDDIEALKTVESNRVGIANYYMWGDSVSSLPSPADRIGRFVSIHTRDNKISICNETNEVYGVTVDSAAFVGGQDNTPRDNSYCLVATTGTVRVQCEQGTGANSVVPGNYVMSSSRGYAKKTANNQYGFYVICIDQIGDKTYAVISLSSTMNQLYNLSTDVIEFNNRINTVEINTAAAINIANSTIKSELEQNINTALSNSQTALYNSNSALSQIGDFQTEISAISTKVDAVDDSVVAATQIAVSDAVDTLTQNVIRTIQGEIVDIQDDIEDAQDTIDGAIEDVRTISENITPFCEFIDGTNVGIAGFVASVENNITQLATLTQYLSKNYTTLDTWGLDDGKDQGKIYYTKDTELYHYYDLTNGWLTTDEPSEAGLLEVITSISQKADENEASISNLTSHIGRDYDIIAEWNGYEKIYDWSEFTPVDNNITYCDISESPYVYYHCDSTILNGDPWVSSTTPPRTDLVEKDTSKIFYAKNTELYYYYNSGHWHATNTPSIAGLVESIALTKQKANKNESSIETINSYIGTNGSIIAGISQKANNNEASINSLTSRIDNEYEKRETAWNENDNGIVTNKIYYAKDPNDNNKWKYWYYNTSPSNPGWVGTENPAEAGLSTAMANISQRVTANESAIDSITTWQDETRDTIAEIRATAGVDGPKIESLVFNLNKYSVGKYSQAYGLSVADAKELLSNGTVFVPTENTSESYKDTNGNYTCSFIREYYYVWSSSTGRWTDYSRVLFSSTFVVGGNSYPYLVTSESYNASDTDAQQLNGDTLYHWNITNSTWEKVATIGTNTLGRAVSQIRQTANEISASVSNVSGDLADMDLRVDDLESSAKFGTAFANKMATIEESADPDGALISLLLANGVQTISTWDPDNPPSNNSLIYYDTTEEEYHYYSDDSSQWVTATNGLDDPNVASKIHSAGIIATINDDESNIKIAASKVNITGLVTIDGLENGTTVINGSCINTGTIHSITSTKTINRTKLIQINEENYSGWGYEHVPSESAGVNYPTTEWIRPKTYDGTQIYPLGDYVDWTSDDSGDALTLYHYWSGQIYQSSNSLGPFGDQVVLSIEFKDKNGNSAYDENYAIWVNGSTGWGALVVDGELNKISIQNSALTATYPSSGLSGDPDDYVQMRPVLIFKYTPSSGKWFAFKDLSLCRPDCEESVSVSSYFDLESGEIHIGGGDYFTKIEDGFISQYLSNSEDYVGGLTITGGESGLYETTFYKQGIGKGVDISRENNNGSYTPIISASVESTHIQSSNYIGLMSDFIGFGVDPNGSRESLITMSKSGNSSGIQIYTNAGDLLVDNESNTGSIQITSRNAITISYVDYDGRFKNGILIDANGVWKQNNYGNWVAL